MGRKSPLVHLNKLQTTNPLFDLSNDTPKRRQSNKPPVASLAKYKPKPSPRLQRGHWYKAEREDTLQKIRVILLPVTTSADLTTGVVTYHHVTDAEQKFKAKMAIYLCEVFYKLMVRLPDIKQYFPGLVQPTVEAIRWAEGGLRHLVPSLVLQRYEQL